FRYADLLVRQLRIALVVHLSDPADTLTVILSLHDALPIFSLVARGVYARPNEYFFAHQDRFRGSWEVGAVLSWTLFDGGDRGAADRKSTRLSSSHVKTSYAVFCLKKKCNKLDPPYVPLVLP